jgi:beta-phosphoglucomutase family hydrolase
MKTKVGYNFAVIFDMDGVIVDNTRYHFKSWKFLASKFGINLTWKYFKTQINGRRAEENVRRMAKGMVSEGEIIRLAEEKEKYYRASYKKFIKPAKGLVDFLILLKKSGIKIAMGTSAPPENIKFVLGRTGTRKFFDKIIDSSGVKKGKPNPEVYLKAAKLLKVPPRRCVVFEDALNGIESAQRAGMKVVAMSTTNKATDLSHADLVVKDFRGLSVEKLSKLFTVK